MTLIRTGSYGDDPTVEAPQTSPVLYVAYPNREPVPVPSLETAPDPERAYMFSGSCIAALGSPASESPLFFEVDEAPFGSIEPQRDGGVAIHVSHQASIIIVPPALAPYVRTFVDPQSAQAYAQTQNALLAALHGMWYAAAQKLKSEAQAMIGRVVVQAAPVASPTVVDEAQAMIGRVVVQAAPVASPTVVDDTARLNWLGSGTVNDAQRDALCTFLRGGPADIRALIDVLRATP